jgi:hypothetical protein
MSRNFFNLLAVLAIIIIIAAACTFRGSRNSNRVDMPPSNNSNPSSPPANSDSSKNKNEDKGDFIVRHKPVKSARYNEIDRQIKADKTLEKAADKLNNALKLPKDIILSTEDCGEINAFFDPNDNTVTVCYELMEYYHGMFKSVGNSEQKSYDKMNDAVRFAFLHEIGHALIHNYKLPITGNEEDAADRCSSFINIEELGDEGVRAVLAAADAFHIESKRGSIDKRSMADEHLLQEQRFYNSLCMLYGSDSSKYDYLVEDGYLPEERAVRCPSEYERTAESWVQLLAPWRKN